MNHLTPDIVIVGGGIAGLWLINRLQAQGYDCLLLENNSLGGAQSVKSQGIIHGGTKYALLGSVTAATQAISAMPHIWRECLQGRGEVDLTQARVLSEHHYLWSAHTLMGSLATFFASRAVSSKVSKSGIHTPAVFLHPQFKGSIYELDEIVLDVPSVIDALATPVYNKLIHTQGDYDWQRSENGAVHSLACKSGTEKITLQAKAFILTGGEGNEALIKTLGIAQPMQRRPLHMVMMKAPNLPPTFAHCLSGGTKPRLTITTHPTRDGQHVWYLGGELSEAGIDKTADEQIALAQQELRTLLPWVDQTAAQWATFHINRAEPAQSNLLRPDTAFTHMDHNVMIAWPTKLALSPSLSAQAIDALKQKNILPSQQHTDVAHLPKPPCGIPAWEEFFT